MLGGVRKSRKAGRFDTRAVRGWLVEQREFLEHMDREIVEESDVKVGEQPVKDVSGMLGTKERREKL
jgi:hypothetical protein